MVMYLREFGLEKMFSYKYLRAFGYRVHIHISKDEVSKLVNEAKEYIFLGYGHKEFKYIL